MHQEMNVLIFLIYAPNNSFEGFHVLPSSFFPLNYSKVWQPIENL